MSCIDSVAYTDRLGLSIAGLFEQEQNISLWMFGHFAGTEL